MAEIVEFGKKEREPLVWRCECGCVTQFVMDTGVMECAHCGTQAGEESGSWRILDLLPDVPSEPKKTEKGDFKVTDLQSPEMAFRRAVKKANPETTCVLLVFQEDGTASVWGRDLVTEDQKEWFDEQCAEAKRILTVSE